MNNIDSENETHVLPLARSIVHINKYTYVFLNIALALLTQEPARLLIIILDCQDDKCNMMLTPGRQYSGKCCTTGLPRWSRQHPKTTWHCLIRYPPSGASVLIAFNIVAASSRRKIAGLTKQGSCLVWLINRVYLNEISSFSSVKWWPPITLW